MKRLTEQLFVYGSLKQGFRFNHLLKSCQFLGSTKTNPRFTMFYTPWQFPGVIQTGNSAIIGEVYAISPAILNKTDILEDYPRTYKRIIIPCEFGPAWIYLYAKKPILFRIIESGNWNHPLFRS